MKLTHKGGSHPGDVLQSLDLDGLGLSEFLKIALGSAEAGGKRCGANMRVTWRGRGYS